MNIQSLVDASSKSKRSSVNLAKLFARSIVVSNDIEAKRLRAKTDLLEVRKSTYAAIKQKEAESDKKDGLVNNLLASLGLTGLAKGLRGAKRPPTAARIRPGRVRGRVPGIGRANLLTNIAFTGLDFMQRRGAGQTNLQAGAGAAGGLLGGMGGFALGAKGGALLGGSIGAAFGGVGAVPGAAIGGILGGLAGSFGGSMLGGYVADTATGVNAGEAEVNRRLREEERRTALLITKTKFSGALDTFDTVLDKLESFRGGICECAEMRPAALLGGEEVTPEMIAAAYEKGLKEGTDSGRVQGSIAGFATAVVVIGGFLFLTRGKGGSIIGKIGSVKEIAGLIKKTSKPTAVPKPTPVKPQAPKVDFPTQTPSISKESGDIGRRLVEEALRKNQNRMFQAKKNIKKLRGEESAYSIGKITKLLRQFSNGDLKQWLRMNGDKLYQSKDGTDQLRAIFNEFRRRGMEVPPKLENFIQKGPTVKPNIGPKASLDKGVQGGESGSNFMIAAEPNTNIVQVPVGGGGGKQIIGSTGATPYQAATKYAQMMSQFTA